MAGIPTEHLAELIAETNRRLIESSDRMADSMQGLRDDFHDFRAEVARELGEIKASVAELRTTVGATLRVVKVLSPFLIGLVLGAAGFAWYASEMHSQVIRIDSRLDRLEARAEKAGPR